MKKSLVLFLCLLLVSATAVHARAAAAPPPLPPDLSAYAGASRAEKEAAYKERFELIPDTRKLMLKMGPNGTAQPVEKWAAVLGAYPDSQKLSEAYGGKTKLAVILMLSGNALLIPGVIFAIAGPIGLGIALDLVAIGVDVAALLFIPKGSDVEAIAEAYNAHTRAALGLD